METECLSHFQLFRGAQPFCFRGQRVREIEPLKEVIQKQGRADRGAAREILKDEFLSSAVGREFLD